MKKCLTGLLLVVLSGCLSGVPSKVDETKASSVAQQALADWVAENKNSQDINQIQGATLDSISVEGNLIHVVLVNDKSAVDANGNRLGEGMHMAYFHVYLNFSYQVVKVVRGPDALS